MNYQRAVVAATWIAMYLIFLSASVFAANITLSWDANTESDLAGYKLYWGTQSKQYIGSQDVGKVTVYTLSGLPDTGTVYFAATAYDTSGNESGKSLEASRTLPIRGCDVNANGVTDIVDLQEIVNAILEGRNHVNADLDQNKRTNVLDLVRFANVLLGKITCPLP